MAIKISGSTIIDDGRSLVNVGVSTISGDLHVGTGVTVFSSTGIVSATAYHHSDGTFLGFRQDTQENLYAGTGAGTDSDADTCFNVAIGYSAGHTNCSGDHNVFLGTYAGNKLTTGGCNIYIGHCSGFNVTSGAHNIGMGVKAGGSAVNSTGQYNVSFGDYAACCLTTGQANISIGKDAGKQIILSVFLHLYQ